MNRKHALDDTRSPPGAPVAWLTSDEPVAYLGAQARMAERAAAIADGTAGELVWLLEHPALYTAGTSAVASDIVSPDRFPVFKSGRGGQYTYHGPGQRIAYLMLDLKARGGDVRRFVHTLESWIIASLAVFGVPGVVRPDRVGVWVEHARDGRIVEDKIAALGIRVSRGVTTHGISINVCPDLEHFSGIVPCGIREHGVTSLADLGVDASLAELDEALKTTFEFHFGSSRIG